MSNEIAEVKKGTVVYEVQGEEVTLSPAIVNTYLKRGNAALTSGEMAMFINLCKYQKLNPFLNEAYIVKFGQTANIITGKEAFMKRAETNPLYDGFRAGLILKSGDEVVEVEGSFYLKGVDVIIGGWAEVHRSDRKIPIVAKVSFDEYSTGKSTWKEKPATMIRKVAIVQAMREAFPTDLGAMYTEEEVGITQEVNVKEEVEQEIKEHQAEEIIDILPNEVAEQQVNTVKKEESEEGCIF